MKSFGTDGGIRSPCVPVPVAVPLVFPAVPVAEFPAVEPDVVVPLSVFVPPVPVAFDPVVDVPFVVPVEASPPGIMVTVLLWLEVFPALSYA